MSLFDDVTMAVLDTQSHNMHWKMVVKKTNRCDAQLLKRCSYVYVWKCEGPFDLCKTVITVSPK